jgi:hypothetical protein
MSENPDLPQPDPALRRLDRLVGSWTMEGNLVGSDEKRAASPQASAAGSSSAYPACSKLRGGCLSNEI